MPEAEPILQPELEQEKQFKNLGEFQDEIIRLKKAEHDAGKRVAAGEKVVWTAHFEDVNPRDLEVEDMEAYNRIITSNGSQEDIDWLNNVYKESVYGRNPENIDSRDNFTAWLANIINTKSFERTNREKRNK